MMYLLLAMLGGLAGAAFVGMDGEVHGSDDDNDDHSTGIDKTDEDASGNSVSDVSFLGADDDDEFNGGGANDDLIFGGGGNDTLGGGSSGAT